MTKNYPIFYRTSAKGFVAVIHKTMAFEIMPNGFGKAAKGYAFNIYTSRAKVLKMENHTNELTGEEFFTEAMEYMRDNLYNVLKNVIEAGADLGTLHTNTKSIESPKNRKKLIK